jgi:hypothetical protein
MPPKNPPAASSANPAAAAAKAAEAAEAARKVGAEEEKTEVKKEKNLKRWQNLLGSKIQRVAAIAKPYSHSSITCADGIPPDHAGCLLAAAAYEFHEKTPKEVTDEELEKAQRDLAMLRRKSNGGDRPDHVSEAVWGTLDISKVSDITQEVKELEQRALIYKNFASGAGRCLLIDMVGCYQVSPLSYNNVTNYFKSMKLLGAPANALPYIAYWASITPQLVEEPAFVSRSESCLFVMYHIGATTSPNLCKLAMENQPWKGFYDDGEEELINEAVAHIWDITYARKISDSTLVKTEIWLEQIERLPDTWYMGSKAAQKFSAIKYNQMKMILKQAKKKMKESLSLEGLSLKGLKEKFDEVSTSAPDVDAEKDPDADDDQKEKPAAAAT